MQKALKVAFLLCHKWYIPGWQTFCQGPLMNITILYCTVIPVCVSLMSKLENTGIATLGGNCWMTNRQKLSYVTVLSVFQPQMLFCCVNFCISALSVVFWFDDTNGRGGPQVQCTHLYVTSYLGQEGSDVSAHQVTNLEQMDISRFI